MRSSLALLIAVCACGSGSPPASTPIKPPPPAPEPPPVPVEPPAPTKPITNVSLAAVGLDAAALDRTADPCEDFYQFACGNWLANAKIAPDMKETGRSFVDIQLRNETYLHDTLEKARTAPGDDPLMKQVGAYYGACMDEAGIEKTGIKPVASLLAQIAKIKDTKSLSATIAALEPLGLNPLFDFGPTEDVADVTKMIAGIDQHGITLPDRDYYLKDDDASKAIRDAYLAFVQALLVEAGHKPDAAKTEAGQLLALETELAKVSKDKVAMRDPKGTYNKIDRAGVAKAMPHFDWDAYFKANGVPDLKDITVSAPDYLTGLNAQLVATPPAVWRNYLVVAVLGRGSSMLTKKLQDIRFTLSQKLEGAAEQKPRWKRCIAQVDSGLSESLGQIFVRDRFPGASKSAAEEGVRALLDAMSRNLDGLDWMDAATKAKAKEKVAAMTYQIGYPAKWRSYSFKISPTTFAANVLAARRAESARQLAKIGKPVDPDEWVMTVPRVNAYNNPVHNQIVFPAGILQTPFYQVDHGVAVNLGAIGMVIGHEITHGFDDEGAQFDAHGNLASWWQPATEKLFKERTQCVVDQYSTYPAGDGKLNGALTVGENIADIGGIKLALAAYRALRASSPDTLVAEGFTEDQQFFLSFGQVWCEKVRPEYEASLMKTDPHSPSRWRVNGGLSDTPDFAKAFQCKLGTKLRPSKVCTVW